MTKASHGKYSSLFLWSLMNLNMTMEGFRPLTSYGKLARRSRTSVVLMYATAISY